MFRSFIYKFVTDETINKPKFRVSWKSYILSDYGIKYAFTTLITV